ncbi:hypothetical protein NA57DRAFT_17408, partial [Rhizodiscina lignyota]
LALPLELRLHIYSFILPHTISTDSDIVNTLKSTPSTSQDNDSTSGNTSRISSLQRSNSMTSLLKTFKAAPVNCTLWRRGHTAILAVNHQIHNEAADVLYGDNFFSLTISYDRMLFHFAWQLPTGLQPRRSFEFLQWFSHGNIRRMRNFLITIEYVDSYTSTVKYNCGGAGLTAGLKGQVERLVKELRRQGGSVTPPLKYVEVMLLD